MSNVNAIIALLVGLLVMGLLTSMAVISLSINVLAAVVLGHWLWTSYQKRSLRGYWPSLGPDMALWGFWVAVLLGAVTLPDLETGERFYVASQAKWVLFLYVLTAAFHHFALPPRRYITLFAAVGAGVAVYGVFQAFTGIDWVRPNFARYALGETGLFRARGFSHNPMTFGHGMAVLFSALVPFLLLRVFKGERLEKLFGAATILVGAAVLFTFTRGAWIAVAAQALVVLFAWNWRHGVKVLGAGLVVLGVVLAVSPAVRERVSSISDTQSDSVRQRFNLWRAHWMMFEDRPLLGIGAGLSKKTIPTYNERIDDKPHLKLTANAHNNFLQVLSNTGIVGFILWLVAMLHLSFVALKNYWGTADSFARALHLGALGAMICIQVGGLTQSTFDDTEVRLTLLLFFAMSLAMRIAPAKPSPRS